MTRLSFLSLMAANADPFYRRLVAYVNARTHLSICVHDALLWQERQQQIERGAVDIAAVCGAVYVRLVDDANLPVQLLAAPVMRGARYGNQPVYFSDVVVRRDSAYQRFADLRGAAWAYNEPGSFSGYHVVSAHLATLGEDAGYFNTIQQCGSHQEALHKVRIGAADAAAIDSIVLGRAYTLQPALASELRTIASLGPNPVPPLVIGRLVAAPIVEAVRSALLTMHMVEEGRQVLDTAQIDRFVAVADHAYAPMRKQLRLAATVALAP